MIKTTNEIITDILTAQLTDASLTISNRSAYHKGHLAIRHDKTGETHFAINIISDDFIGLSAVERQRKIYDLLKHLMPKPIHAVNLCCLTRSESLVPKS
ncbi:MAG: BolA family protein [Alphaproteobacteria bacterium]